MGGHTTTRAGAAQPARRFPPGLAAGDRAAARGLDGRAMSRQLHAQTLPAGPPPITTIGGIISRSGVTGRRRARADATQPQISGIAGLRSASMNTSFAPCRTMKPSRPLRSINCRCVATPRIQSFTGPALCGARSGRCVGHHSVLHLRKSACQGCAINAVMSPAATLALIDPEVERLAIERRVDHDDAGLDAGTEALADGRLKMRARQAGCRDLRLDRDGGGVEGPATHASSMSRWNLRSRNDGP